MMVTCRVRMRRPLHMRMRMLVNDTVACVANGVAVDVTVSYKRRRLETSLNRRRDMLLSGSVCLGRRDSSSCVFCEPRF